MSSHALLSITYWNHFARFCREHNVDIAPICSTLGISESAEFIPFEHLKALIDFVLDNTKTPAIGLQIAQRIQISSHGSLGFALSHAENLKECLELVNRYYQTRAQFVRFDGHTKNGQYQLTLNATCDWGSASTILYEVVLSSILNIIEYAIGKDIEQCSIDFPFTAPEWSGSYPHYLPCPITFNSSVASINIPLPLLSVPCISSNPRTVDLAKNQCDIELTRVNQYDTLAEKVAFLIENSERLNFSIEQVSQKLNISKSTLIRKLKREQSSYKSIMEKIKKQQASQLLIDSNISIEAISFQLGYEDHSNFGRSFKRWFGCSPSVYRQTHQTANVEPE